jgi:type II secretory pathway pseudopilin PulG
MFGKNASLTRQAQRKGISLVASLIVIVIIVIALFPLLRALSISLFVSSDTESTMIAANLLQSKMEEIRALSFDQIASEAKAPVENSPGFQRAVSITSPYPKLKKIKVTVYWKQSGGTEDNLFLETYAADY